MIGLNRYEVLLPRFQADALPLDEQGATTLHNDHVLIVVMNMFGSFSSFAAGPESHWAPVRTAVRVTFNSRCMLSDPMDWVLHERGKIMR